MKLKSYFSIKRCIFLGFLFWILGAVICFAGLVRAGFKTEQLQYPGKTPWYQTVHFNSDNYTALGITFSGGNIIGLGSWNNTLFLSSNLKAQFNGSRTGNDSQFLMDFSVFNTSDSQLLYLKKGDILDISLSLHSGFLNVNIQKIAELSESPDLKTADKSIKFAPLYRKQDIADESCELTIPEDGIYDITVIGQNAAGKVSFVKQDTDI